MRPRVFSFEISSGGNAYSQDLMQDWAAVNSGHYAHMSTIGDMEVGFDRATCLLRRPAAYVLSLATRSAAPPLPIPTPTPEATPTPAPTATPEPTPTPVFAGNGAIAVAAAPIEADAGQPTAFGGGAIEVILDASGSMLQQLEGRRKIEIARDVLTNLVTQGIAPGTPLALRVFGNREADSCRTDLEAPLQPLDPAAVAGIVAGIDAINLARTPIADSLRLVEEDLANASGPRVVVLVTDGEETCGGDPAQVIQDLRAKGFDVRINIVGFNIDDPALQQTFEQWAKLGGGLYFNATNAAELGAAVVDAVRPTFRVLDAAGTVVATGVVGGDSVPVPAGIYTVEAAGNPPQRYEQVTVQDGQDVTLAPSAPGFLPTPTPAP